MEKQRPITVAPISAAGLVLAAGAGGYFQSRKDSSSIEALKARIVQLESQRAHEENDPLRESEEIPGSGGESARGSTEDRPETPSGGASPESSGGGSNTSRKPRDEPQVSGQELRGNGHVFSFRSCFASGSDITCSLLIASDEDGELLLHTDGSTRLFDNLGNEYAVDQVTFGKKHNQGTRRLAKTLISGVSVEATFTFRGVSPEWRNIAVLEVAYRAPRTSWASSVKFRDIDLSM